jgi:hypothetical protein
VVQAYAKTQCRLFRHTEEIRANAKGRVQAPPSIDYNKLPKAYPMPASGVTDLQRE